MQTRSSRHLANLLGTGSRYWTRPPYSTTAAVTTFELTHDPAVGRSARPLGMKDETTVRLRKADFSKAVSEASLVSVEGGGDSIDTGMSTSGVEVRTGADRSTRTRARGVAGDRPPLPALTRLRPLVRRR
jgi:hypothetical protein